MKKALLVSVLVILVQAIASVAFGQEAADAQKIAGLDILKWTLIASGFTIAIAAFGGALGQSAAVKAACEGIARNPEASGKITVTMIIGLALIESLVIYALVICLIMLFANPANATLKLLGLA